VPCVRGSETPRVGGGGWARRSDPAHLIDARFRMLADDFAPQLSADDLASLATSIAADRPVVVLAAAPARLAQLRQEIDPRRVELMLRELVMLVRRSLRGTDAVALVDDELLVVIDGPMSVGQPIAARLLAAVRAHRFTGGAADLPVRLTLSVGGAAAPDHGRTFAQLARAARRVQAEAGADNAAFSHSHEPAGLDLERFVGRAEPLARLSESLDDMVRGVARVVAVIGESGVGSSSLVRMLGPEVRLRGGSLISAACHEQRLPEPYALWSEVLRAVRRLPVKSTRQWRELPSLDPSLERAPAELSRGGSKVRLLEELADFLRLAAQQRPLFILLDDMQWADDASWDALEHLIPQIESERLVLALTIRTDERSDDILERWARLSSRPHHDEIRMTRLTRDDVKRWVEGAMAHGEAGRDLLAYLYRHTEGNPLHLVHLLRDLEESGHLAREGERWRWSDLHELPTDVSFVEVVRRRIERLPAHSLPMLELTATLDREFDEDLLRRVGDWDESARRESIGCLVDARLLTPTYDRDTASYLFSHDELARITRASLPAERRAALHARLAAAMAESASASQSLIATHYEAAGQGAEAHRHAVLAANAALRLYDSAAASTLLTVAATYAPSPHALASVRAQLAELAEKAGHYEDAEALCDLALNWYEGSEDPVQAIRLKRMRTLVRMRRGQGARETLSSLFALVDEATLVGADAERASILLMSSQMLGRLGDPAEAQRVAEECLAIAERCADPLLLSDSVSRLGACLLLSDGARARALFVRALELVVPLNDVVRRVTLLHDIGILELVSSRWDDARRSLEEAVEHARSARLIALWARASLHLGVLAIRSGQLQEASAPLDEALRLSAEAQHTELQLVVTYNLANLARDMNEFRRARDTYELARDLADRIGQSEIHLGATGGMGVCHIALGELEEAARIHSLLDESRRTMPDWFQGRELVEALAIRLAVLAGRDDAIRMLSDAALRAEAQDPYAAALLIAEFGPTFLESDPEVVDGLVRRFRGRPEVSENARLRQQFGVLMLDSARSS
jgi:tetratricopeptide (TPR) repeat protein